MSNSRWQPYFYWSMWTHNPETFRNSLSMYQYTYNWFFFSFQINTFDYLDQICFELIHNCSKSKDIKCLEQIQDDYSCQCPSTICEYNHKNQIIGFIENTCPPDHFQGIHWPKTLANKGQHMPCPYPCTGMIS
jgi:hypothetical protein